MLAKLLRNECDVLNAPISSQLPAIEKNPDIVLQTTPAMNVAFIAVNTQHPALNDNRVRKALNFAINRQNILDSVYYGTGSIAFTILPPPLGPISKIRRRFATIVTTRKLCCVRLDLQRVWS